MRLLARFGITGDLRDLRILEDAHVEIGGFFRLTVEPQARGDFLAELHECFSVTGYSLHSRTAARRIDNPVKIFARRAARYQTTPTVACYWRTSDSSSSSRLRPRVSGRMRASRATPSTANNP